MQHNQPAAVQQVLMQPVQIQTQQQSKPLSKYNKNFYILGVIEVVIAAVCFTSGVILVSLSYSYNAGYISYISSAIWCSVPLFVTGSLGIAAQKSTSRCLIITGMVMAIVTSLFMLVLLGISISGAVYYTSNSYYYNDINIAAAVFHSLNSLMSFVGFVIVITHSAYCCRDTCCGVYNANARYGYVASTQQVIQLPNGQAMVIVQGHPNTAPTANVQYNYVQPGMPVTQIPTYSPQVMAGPSNTVVHPAVTQPMMQNETKEPLPDDQYSEPPPQYQAVQEWQPPNMM